MRKITFLVMFSLLTVSCQNDQSQNMEPPETVVTLKSDAMNRFDNALKKIAKGQENYIGGNKELND